MPHDNIQVWNYYVNRDPEQDLLERMRAGQNRSVSRNADRRKSSTQARNTTGILGRLLGIDAEVVADIRNELGSQAALDVTKFATVARRKALENKTKVWTCKWPRDEILRVWRTPRHKLATEEEKHAFDLLQKYSGTYKSYAEAQSTWNTKHAQQFRKDIGRAINWKQGGKVASRDVDYKARVVLRELDRAESTHNMYMDTDAIHANDHRYATELLQVQLQEELDSVLAEQIRDTERARRRNVDSSEDDDSSDGGLSDDVSLDDVDAEEAFKRKIEQEQRAERRARREKRRTKLDELDKIRAKKMVQTKNKSGTALVEALFQNELGVGGCIACRVNPCRWEPCIDEDACYARRRELEDEVGRVKEDKESTVFESTIALTAQMGGNTVFRRLDLIYDLNNELKELSKYIDLNNVDKELHDAYASRKEYIEVKHLHGFSAMLWTNNARVALQQRQNRLVAQTVVKEAIDDILDWMLEGWYFGERESYFSALGYVPSLKPGATERVRAGQDQIRTVGTVVQRMKARAEAKTAGVVLDEFRRGVVVEKSRGIDECSQFNLVAKQIIKEGEDQKHLLNETENTFRFGLFMMTLMYFRAMALLRREKRSWGGEDDEVNKATRNKKTVPKMTLERMRIVDEEHNVAARRRRMNRAMERAKVGEMRKKERLDAVRREEVQRKQAILRRRRLEDKSVRLIQQIARGYWGRRAARHWALKRAEWEAMKAVMNAAATTLQRRWRGVLGRRVYADIRIEMAQFIAIVRLREADVDEEEFWVHHPWRRFKRDARDWTERKLLQLGEGQRTVYGAPKFEDEDHSSWTWKDLAIEVGKEVVKQVDKRAPGAVERERARAEARAKEEYVSDDGLEDEPDYEPRRRPKVTADGAGAAGGTDTLTAAGGGEGADGSGADVDADADGSNSTKSRGSRKIRGKGRGRGSDRGSETDSSITDTARGRRKMKGKKDRSKNKDKNMIVNVNTDAPSAADLGEATASDGDTSRGRSVGVGGSSDTGRSKDKKKRNVRIIDDGIVHHSARDRDADRANNRAQTKPIDTLTSENITSEHAP
jgi:hypothetical protein